ncbi:MAG: SGNH/GDSL hydrolase family protein, partial [Lachnospiraceae bacterium]|nr:SGNH/GDSL hydrolase family protein [Lachnospiraceae bacterium]
NMTVSGNETVSGNDASFGWLLGSVSENDAEVNYYDGSMTENSIFDEWRYIYEQPEMSLEERKELRTSYQETLEVNQSDRERIAENQHDFSEMKIACLGDSITAAVNLDAEENYEQYAYPAKLQELLGAEEVYNLGIGGSSIGRYWADAFVDRYTQIPEDVDIIIVLGGTNDGFCVSDDEFGSLEERDYRTFCGDLNELMGGLRENYPDAVIFFATPLPNVLQDYLMSEREYLLPQRNFVEVIKTLAKEYDFELIDLYNSNILDSHDANVIAEYMPDGVHGNHEGYQILAEHFASEIVQYYNEDETEADTDNDNQLNLED